MSNIPIIVIYDSALLINVIVLCSWNPIRSQLNILWLNKLRQDKAKWILIIPVWKSASYWPIIQKKDIFHEFIKDIHYLPQKDCIFTGDGKNGVFVLVFVLLESNKNVVIFPDKLCKGCVEVTPLEITAFSTFCLRFIPIKYNDYIIFFLYWPSLWFYIIKTVTNILFNLKKICSR
jgi:hypothetical protein